MYSCGKQVGYQSWEERKPMFPDLQRRCQSQGRNMTSREKQRQRRKGGPVGVWTPSS